MSSAVDYGPQLPLIVTKLLPLCCGVLWLMAHLTPAENLSSLESKDALSAGALGFIPRILVLTTLPHRQPKSYRFERVNGRHSGWSMRPPVSLGSSSQTASIASA